MYGDTHLNAQHMVEGDISFSTLSKDYNTDLVMVWTHLLSSIS